MNQRLWQARVQSGLSAAQMDLQLNMARGTVARWEATGGIPEDQVKAICNLLEVSEQWLRTGISEASEADMAEADRILHGVRGKDKREGLRRLLLSHYRKAT